MLRLWSKLSRFKQCLRWWNKCVFKNLFSNIKDAEANVSCLENIFQLNPLSDNLSNLNQAKDSLLLLQRQEECYWHQKSNAKFIVEGDKNTKFFLALANKKKSRSYIHKIFYSDGSVLNSDESICNSVVAYFKNIFTSSSTCFPITNSQFIPNIICEADNNKLCQTLSEDEILRVIKDLNSNAVAGLDGFTTKFFQVNWEIIKEDVINAVADFFAGNPYPKFFSFTYIVLIPKIDGPNHWHDFRPISLCTFLNKLNSKIISNRMEKIIHKIISTDQAAFVRGRSLSDHVLLAQEVFNKFRFSKARSGMFSIKLDMEQAYDSMGWQTLRQALTHFNFPSKFLELVLQCVLNPKFSILIYGKRTGWIEGRCGFRQGCPLSPILFILCSQILSDALLARKSGMGISISPMAPRVSHLLYADDILIFAEAKFKEVKELKGIISNYCKWIGQRVNNCKSMIMFGRFTKRSIQKKIVKKLKFKVVKEINYLGVKMTLRRLIASDFQVLLEAATNRLNTWGKKCISLDGKLVLLKSSFLSLPQFVYPLSLVPVSILKEFDKMCRGFLWSKNNGNAGIHYDSWKLLCKPRIEGGRVLFSAVTRVGPLRSNLLGVSI
ncbi:Putative ribonuclease H protein [Dendrobium catenatum]|uniref:Ribonuclease H protein n=1 Tax=Dendrobium catenatum TaxID=906689 RepID=A0A2I0X2H7_9ASPA|nr:Putative ribonuclease H protein [Dendrobium catenatum]